MKILDILLDKRTDCISVLATMKLEEYRYFAYDAFINSGNLEGQRDVIKRSSVAAKIRKRMQSDFEQGAVFPPVVMGVLINKDEDEYNKLFLNANKNEFEQLLQNIDIKYYSIIDGMQRTNIYFENPLEHLDTEIRVEFWISNNSVKLLYRMLVLNTGQVPWNTRRQMELVYSGLSASINNDVFNNYPELTNKLNIIGIDDNTRRTVAGTYSKSNVIEMYLGFNTRSIKVNTNDELADEFQRFDMLESVDKNINFKMFIEVFAYLCKIDLAFSNISTDKREGQFSVGKDIFTSQPACLGFVVAASEFIFGKISTNRSEEKITEQFNVWKSRMQKFILLIEQNEENDFLALNSLMEIIEKLSKTKIGDELRQLFKNAFSELMRYEYIEEINNLESFWRS